MKVIVSNTMAKVTEPEHLTSGMIGKTFDVEFLDGWDGLNVIAVFPTGKDPIIKENPASTMEIPPESLAVPGVHCYVGFYGFSIVDGKKVIAIPTIYADLGKIDEGTDPNGSPGTDVSPTVAEQLLAMIGDLSQLKTEEKNNLVAAVNEVFTRGGGGSSILAMRVSGGYIQYTTDNKTWNNLIAVSDLKGAKGDTGPKGDQGPQGIPGAKGDTGAAGERGPQGEQGIQGPAGAKGDKGDPGERGEAGPAGSTGPQGPAGHTPQKGVDYFTQADKSELVAAVLDALPDGDEVSY